MEKIVEKEGISNFQECSGENWIRVWSNHDSFSIDISCGQAGFVKAFID